MLKQINLGSVEKDWQVTFSFQNLFWSFFSCFFFCYSCSCLTLKCLLYCWYVHNKCTNAFSPYFASFVGFLFQLQTDVCHFCLFLTQKYKDNFEMWSKGIRKRKCVALSGDTRTRIKSFSICKYLQFVNNVLSPLSALTSTLCPLQRRPILRNPTAASRDGAIFSGESRIIPNSSPWVSEIEEDLLNFVFNSQLRIMYC